MNIGNWKSKKAIVSLRISAQPLTFIHSSFGLISTGFIRLRWKDKETNCQAGNKATTTKLKLGK